MKTLLHLLLDELATRTSAEDQIMVAMPRIALEATCTHLQNLIYAQLEETVVHSEKLSKVFTAFGEDTAQQECVVTAALIHESTRVASEFINSSAINAALVSVAQKIKHFEIASYGCLHEWAQLLGNTEAAGLLEEILDEKKSANHALIKLAQFRCNKEALHEYGAVNVSCDTYGHRVDLAE